MKKARKDDAPCRYCGEIMNYRHEEKWKHYMNCEKAKEQMIKGVDYVICPICGEWKSDLGTHFIKVHKMDKKQRELTFPDIIMQCSKNIETRCDIFEKKYGSRSPLANKEIGKKTKRTILEKYGVENIFASPEIQDKIKETNREKYGCDYPMQNEDIFCKQQKSVNNAPNNLERFFDEHTCDSVVFTGYGGRYVRVKKGVRKDNRVVKNLCPDFMIFPDNVVGSARSLSLEKNKLDRATYRSRYVIELLGDYYHSEAITGVSKEDHEREIVDAYASINIKCLTIWECDINNNWEEVRVRIDAWIDIAVSEINKNPIIYKSTKSKEPRLDKRIARFECPFGSGKVFISQEKLDLWISSDENLYRPELIEGKDYVICKECGYRFVKLGAHLSVAHDMSDKQYLLLHPGSQLISTVLSDVVSNNLKGKIRGAYSIYSAYRLPDGDIVRSEDIWLMAWDDNAPKESEFMISDVKLDKLKNKFKDKVEEVDYVVCTICGFKGKTIARHVNSEHDIDNYVGELKSESCASALSDASNKSWKSRDRSIEDNKYGITKEILEKYVYEDKLNNKEIGLKFGLRNDSIAYYRKKFGVLPLRKEKKVKVVVKKRVDCGLTEKDLKKYVFEEGLHDKEIGDLYGVSKDTIRIRRKKYGINVLSERERISIKALKSGKKDICAVSREDFLELSNKKEMREMARIFGCSTTLIKSKMDEFGV